jgi:hypothetical protein
VTSSRPTTQTITKSTPSGQVAEITTTAPPVSNESQTQKPEAPINWALIIGVIAVAAIVIGQGLGFWIMRKQKK